MQNSWAIALRAAAIVPLVLAGCAGAAQRPDPQGALLSVVDRIQRVEDVAPAAIGRTFGVQLIRASERSRTWRSITPRPDGLRTSIGVTSIEHDRPDAVRWAVVPSSGRQPAQPEACTFEFETFAAELKARGFTADRVVAGPWGDPPPDWARDIWNFHRGSTRVGVWAYVAKTPLGARCVNNVVIQLGVHDAAATYSPPEPIPQP